MNESSDATYELDYKAMFENYQQMINQQIKEFFELQHELAELTSYGDVVLSRMPELKIGEQISLYKALITFYKKAKKLLNI